MTLEQWAFEYGLPFFLYALYKAIPDSWKEATAVAKFQQVDELTSGQKTVFENTKSRELYSYFVKELKESYKLQIKDGQSNFALGDKDIRQIFNRFRSTTHLNKYREFQFKLLHGAIYTKEKLEKFGFVPNNSCSFCQQELPPVDKKSMNCSVHVFLKCLKVKQLWERVIQQFDLAEIKELDWNDIFLGLKGNSVRIKFVNTVIIFMKYVIYKSRQKGSLPTLVTIEKSVLEFIEEEKKLAIKMGKLGMHLLKWEYIN